MPTIDLEDLDSSNINFAVNSDRPFITVGVSYRTDSHGRIHEEYDCSTIRSLNDLRDKAGNRRLEFDVKIKTLPIGAQGASLNRNLSNESILLDLEDVDLLYIPGGPNALESQEATSFAEPARSKEANFNKASAKMKGNKPDSSAIQKYNEYMSRDPYENRLIELALTRGIVILAVCGGSWRLLHAYGGVPRSLPEVERAKHYCAGNVWSISHPIEILEGSILDSCVLHQENPLSSPSLLTVNTTHWAVPKVVDGGVAERANEPEKLARRLQDPSLDSNKPLLDPGKLLEIVAYSISETGVRETPEAFIARSGAPNLGTQFHPETYLPAGPGKDTATHATRSFAQELFVYMSQAAFAYKTRRNFIANSPGLSEPETFSEKYKTPIEHLYRQGCAHYHGDPLNGISVNMQQAFHYFEQAAFHGHAGAEAKLGDIYEWGRSVPSDLSKAVHYYQRAAAQGHVLGLFSLGLCYERSRGVQQDLYKAAELFQAAYDKGYEGWKGYFSEFLNRHLEVREYLEFVKEKTKLSVEQHLQRGLDFYHGNSSNGIVRDMKKAARHLRIAAEQGNAAAQVKLGDILEFGRDDQPANMAEALMFYRLAADQKDSMGLFCLGLCYEREKGVERDLFLAAKYFHAAYERGYEGWKNYFVDFKNQYPQFFNAQGQVIQPMMLSQFNNFVSMARTAHDSFIAPETSPVRSRSF